MVQISWMEMDCVRNKYYIESRSRGVSYIQ
jgi:hypothetical protein